VSIGEYSIRKTPDAYFGMARICGLKNDAKEALQWLAAAQREFGGDLAGLGLRSKTTEGLVYHESGDYRRARKTGDELEALLRERADRPDIDTCMEMATLLFAVGVKDAPVDLLCYVTRNNHDHPVLLDQVQKLFERARMAEEGEELIRSSCKQASDLMNQGVLLWKTGKLREAVEWMRNARVALPNNQRILFNAAQVLVSHMQKYGYDAALAGEAHEVLLHVDRLQPGQQRFAQLMEQLVELTPKEEAPDGVTGQAA
jgi:tetratricopeptide (TPR) repeat protein